MKNLFVGNIPHSTTEGELRPLFEAHGAVERVSIVTDRETGRSRGFAFVEMTDADAADKAIAALDGSDLGGRPMKVNEARPKEKSRRPAARRTFREEAAAEAVMAADAMTIADTRRQPREPRW